MPNKITQEEFIKKASIVHSGKYSYDKVVYKNMLTKVIIICPIHGEFQQRPADHLKGYGCRETAFWAMTELCAWWMTKNYLDEFLVSEADNYNIYKIGDRFIKKSYHEDGIVEVKQVVKMIPVIDWEEVK
jgi:hypothetical protein